MYISQMAIIEEEMNNNHLKIQHEKEKYEEMLAEVNEHYHNVTE